jgi:hypothetical protein
VARESFHSGPQSPNLRTFGLIFDVNASYSGKYEVNRINNNWMSFITTTIGKQLKFFSLSLNLYDENFFCFPEFRIDSSCPQQRCRILRRIGGFGRLLSLHSGIHLVNNQVTFYIKRLRKFKEVDKFSKSL